MRSIHPLAVNAAPPFSARPPENLGYLSDLSRTFRPDHILRLLRASLRLNSMDQPQHPSGLAGTAVITSLSPASTASQHRKRSFTSSQAYTSDGSVAGIRQDSQRKQHKVSRACDLCKAKKARCSGTLPCEGCTRKGVECVYDAKYSRGRPPTPPPAPSVVAVSLTGPAFTGSRHANSR